MKTSEQINELAAALAVAQGVIANATKDSENPFFTSSYADLASVWDAIRGPLSTSGLSVMQLPSTEGPKVTITTVLAHKSGQWVSSELTVTAKDNAPQSVGSAITYARRYALQSIAGVAPEDDDGEGAEGRDTKPQPKGTGNGLISQAQQGRLIAIGKSSGKSDEQLKAILKQHGFAKSADVTRAKYDAVCGAITEAK